MTIWQRFNEEGIEFPYPQREVRILQDDNDETPAVLPVEDKEKLSETAVSESK